MNCEKCGKEHDGVFGSGRFCSLACSRSHPMSEGRRQKIKSGVDHWITKMKTEDPCKWAKYIEEQSNRGKTRVHWLKESSSGKSWEELGIDGKKNRVKQEQNQSCNLCGLSEWRGQKLALEIEHKDGQHQNNERENLEALCPNCHSLTETWRGKNKSNQGKVSDAQLIHALKNTENIRQVLIAVGMSPRGKNYVRAKRLKLEALAS